MGRVRVRVEGIRVFICPSEPSRERVKVSHVIVECRVINHHPNVYCLSMFFILSKNCGKIYTDRVGE